MPSVLAVLAAPPWDRRIDRGRGVWLAAVLIGLVGGCAREGEIDTAYGQRRGEAARSVNGTSVLADVWERAGATVLTRTRLSTDLDTFQVLVWVPDDFHLPSEPVQQYLEDWLGEGPNRTLVYVGRDYDAATEYWKALVPQVGPEQCVAMMRSAARARSAHVERRRAMPPVATNAWCTVRRDERYQPWRDLQGPWAEGVQDAHANLWGQSQLQVPTPEQLEKLGDGQPPPLRQQPVYRVLLQSGQTPLVLEITRPDWATSKILLVANGSFLLNAPLVNYEHRVLAGHMIRACGSPDVKVGFLESGPDGLPISELAQNQLPSESRRRRALMAIHWLVFGLLICFAVFPIFGRPRAPQTETVADFGQHVEALGRLLEKTGNMAYARQLLEDYRRVAYRESGARHAGAGNPRPAGKGSHAPDREP